MNAVRRMFHLKDVSEQTFRRGNAILINSTESAALISRETE